MLAMLLCIWRLSSVVLITLLLVSTGPALKALRPVAVQRGQQLRRRRISP